MKETDSAGLDSQHTIAAFFAVQTLILSAAMLAFRAALPMELGLVLGTAGLTLTTMCLPIAVLARLVPSAAAILVGPGALLAIILCVAVTYLGAVGQWLLPLLGAASLLAMLLGRRAASPAVPHSPWWSWLLLTLLCAVITIFVVAGTKYSNFFADQLALYGRTDGDVFSFGAIINSIRYYGSPSMAIDGLAPLHYHVATYALAGRLDALYDRNAIVALVSTKILFLTPLLIWATTFACHAIGSALQQRISARAAVLTALLLVLFLPLAGVGNARFASESMMFGAALALMLLPAGLTLAGPQPMSRWWIVILPIPLLCGVKISVGFVWGGMVGVWLLRRYGLKQAALWVLGAISSALFLIGYRLFGDTGAMGGHLFGTPYFVKYGFEKGDPLMPLWMLIEFVAAFLLLWRRKRRGDLDPGMIRFLAVTLAAALAFAVLPGVLMDIEGANAYYFIASGDWIAIGILAALVPDALIDLGQVLARIRTWVPAVAGGVAILAIAVLDARDLMQLFDTFAAGKALLVTGDTTYYATDKIRGWRKDTARALKEIGLGHLLLAPFAPPPGQALTDEMNAARNSARDGVAVYVPADNRDYWNLVMDCDGKSLYPIAMAGLPLLDGFTPDHMGCPMEIALRGFGPVPPVPLPANVPAICGRAKERGFPEVLWVDDLHDPTRNRIIDCRSAG